MLLNSSPVVKDMPPSSSRRSSKKKSGRIRFRRWFKRKASKFEVVWKILLFPIWVLLLPFDQKILALFHYKGVETKRPKNLTFRQKVGRFLKWNFWFPFKIAASVLKPIQKRLKKTKLRDFVYILPALFVIAFLIFVFSSVFVRGDKIKNQYLINARTAFVNKDYALAKTYYQRLVTAGELPKDQLFVWAVILSKTGEGQKASRLIDKLAPDSEAGFSSAHEFKALQISRNLSADKAAKVKDPEILKKLKWHLDHLDHTKDRSPEISEVWAAYCFAVGDTVQAIGHLENSAKKKPFQYVLISEYHKNQGDADAQKQSLENAETAFRQLLADDKFNHPNRISLANVLVRQENIREARRVLLNGLLLQPDPQIRHAIADFLVMQHDKDRQSNNDVGAQLQFLVDAIKMDPNHVKIYKRLVAMHKESKQSTDRLAEIRSTLQDIVASEQSTALAHLALSNVHQQEGNIEHADFHLEQAYKADKDMPFIVNNLAWCLAHSADPDLDRALELAEKAVRQRPEDPRIRDTYGTILFKLERYRESASELNLALQGAQNPKQIHDKLAAAYDKLGMVQQARIHREKSDSMEKETKKQ